MKDEGRPPAPLRLERAYRTVIHASRALLRGTGEAEVAAAICQIAVEVAGYRFAWVGYAEHDRERTLRPVAQFGFDHGYLESLNLTWGDGPRANGPSATAIRTGQVQVTQQLATDPRFTPWRAHALARGYGSSVALPLQNGGDAFGTLNLYAPEPNAFDDEELALLGLLSEDLAQAILRARGKLQLSRLQQRLERAERLDAVGRTAAVLSHDMNNALAAALGTLELLGRKLPHELDGAFRDARSALDEAVTLNKRIQDFARQSSSRSGRQRLHLDDALRELEPRLRRLLPDAVLLHVQQGASSAWVRMDRTTLERLLTNFVVNARDAMPEGGTITVQTGVQELRHPLPEQLVGLEPGRYVAIKVIDTGTGIASENMERLFEPFFTTKGTLGTGLGLPSAYGIVRQAGGAISVVSELGKGSTFEVLLPLQHEGD
ncbi:MAG: GAF domain-containing protein [Deltaproteobacteria bacterium]|nr:GAF domain-containing protein [Deltaproteobacteria bacterium]